jgi:hypothetical protein
LSTAGAAEGSDIEAELTELGKLIEKTGAKSYRPFLYEESARLACLLGNDSEGERLREAERLFAEIGAPAHAERMRNQHAS